MHDLVNSKAIDLTNEIDASLKKYQCAKRAIKVHVVARV